MNDDYFKQILTNAIANMTALVSHRENLDIQILKLRELIHATANMLMDDKERNKILEVLNAAIRHDGFRDASLVDAIRGVLQETRGKFLTVSDVRDRLKIYGFDFSEYASNPLASISTTLRRFKPEEVETTSIEGVAAYRWKGVRRFPRLRVPFADSSKKKFDPDDPNLPVNKSGMRGMNK
jgi:hypothetical protein